MLGGHIDHRDVLRRALVWRNLIPLFDVQANGSHHIGLSSLLNVGRPQWGDPVTPTVASKKTAATKVAPTISPDPDTQDDGGQTAPLPAIDIADPPAEDAPVTDTPVETVDVFVAEVQDAPPSSITIAVGTAGYFTGARPAETLAQYKTRLGTTYGTFGDLGTMLGTAPKA